METPGGNLYIPDRNVDCALRRGISRNTHYMLTDTEADEVRNDPRVLAVELLPKDRNIIATPYWDQTGNFEKSSTVDQADKNWGLLRCINGFQISGWGTNGGAETQKTNLNIKTTSSGKNVDVVIVDAHVNPNHPEFAAYPDGSGGGRVNTIDWYQYNDYTGVVVNGSYDYSTVSSNHGTHVAGTACGNTQGWARDANIYTIEFNYSNSPVAQWDLILFDYIRSFHRNKPINPETGRRNPTVTNHSWGYSYNNINLTNITSVTYRGVTTDISTLTTAQKKTELESKGVPVPAGTYLYKMPVRIAALDADIQDAINDGVIVVSSAGNSYWQIARDFGDIDYNNYLTISGTDYYHAQGSSPGAADNVICVGSLGSEHVEKKANYSNWGSRIDIWAPGTNIISSVYNSSAATEFGISLVTDIRNSSYYLGSISGTSMASPQVCGVLACLAEQEPDMTQSDAINYISNYGMKEGQIFNQEPNADWITNGSLPPTQSPYDSLLLSDNNKLLYYVKERQLTGPTTPKTNFKRRPTFGAVYPRVRGRR